MHPTIEQESFKSWLVCLSAALFFFYEFIQMNMLNNISADLLREFSISPERLGFFSASFFYADALFLLPAGLLLDHFSVRKIIIYAMILCVLGTLMLATSKFLILAEIGRFVTGFCNSFALLGCIKLISRWFPPKRFALLIGITVTIGMFGGMIAQAPFAFLVVSSGWRTVLYIDSCIGLIITLIIGLNVHDSPAKLIKPLKISLKNISIWNHLTIAAINKLNWRLGIFIAFMNLPLTLLGALWGNLYLLKVYKLNLPEASIASSALFSGMMIGSLAIGWFADHMGNHRKIMISSPLMLTTITLLLILNVKLSFTYILSFFILIGFFCGCQVVGFSYVIASNPKTTTTTAQGLVSAIIMICTALFQPLYGRLTQSSYFFISGTSDNYRWALLILPFTTFISFLIALNFKEINFNSFD